MTEPSRRRSLRLWPGVALAVMLLLVRFAVPAVVPEGMSIAILGGVAGGMLILLWWLFLSRAPWGERIGTLLFIIAALVVTKAVAHPSISGGMMGMMLFIYLAPPAVGLALVGWAVATRDMSEAPRRLALAAVVLLICSLFAIIRTDGILGDGSAQLAWRWTPTPEERLLAAQGDLPAPPVANAPDAPAVPVSAGVAAPPTDVPGPRPGTSADPGTPAPAEPIAPAADPEPPAAEWNGFRGASRDGAVRLRIGTDWTASPPAELWRRPIGPGWSSFAVRDGVLYTQEQRGDSELVAAYRVSSGEPVWRHSDPVRFYESNGGAGPRATPAIRGDRVYAFGATGILNALDAATGALVWTRNASADTEVEVPGWGFTSSPLVVDDLVIVGVSGALAAYDAGTGDQRWILPSAGGSYSSPHLAAVDGVRQVLFLGGSGVRSVAPADGRVLWESAWKGSPIVQPAVLPDGDVLVTTADVSGGVGMRRLSAKKNGAGWVVEERWTSNGLKPYFNDYVVHEGHAFGFDGRILSCISLEDGARKWKGGRYGQGQMVLLPEQDLLLVLSEDGELVLVGATSDQFREIARAPALNAKTWNHPVIVGDVLLVRNGEEMAAFRLPRPAR